MVKEKVCDPILNEIKTVKFLLQDIVWNKFIPGQKGLKLHCQVD